MYVFHVELVEDYLGLLANNNSCMDNGDSTVFQKPQNKHSYSNMSFYKLVIVYYYLNTK